jgi:hypothetical protein
MATVPLSCRWKPRTRPIALRKKRSIVVICEAPELLRDYSQEKLAKTAGHQVLTGAPLTAWSAP